MKILQINFTKNFYVPVAFDDEISTEFGFNCWQSSDRAVTACRVEKGYELTWPNGHRLLVMDNCIASIHYAPPGNE